MTGAHPAAESSDKDIGSLMLRVVNVRQFDTHGKEVVRGEA